MALEKILRQLDHVLPAMPKWRHLNIDSVETIVQIQPEAPLTSSTSERFDATMMRVSTG
jgi:hypothetical protein